MRALAQLVTATQPGVPGPRHAPKASRLRIASNAHAAGSSDLNHSLTGLALVSGRMLEPACGPCCSRGRDCPGPRARGARGTRKRPDRCLVCLRWQRGACVCTGALRLSAPRARAQLRHCCALAKPAVSPLTRATALELLQIAQCGQDAALQRGPSTCPLVLGRDVRLAHG